jgi:hypothetical protein
VQKIINISEKIILWCHFMKLMKSHRIRPHEKPAPNHLNNINVVLWCITYECDT